MIQLANEITRPFVRQMWKTCFGDSNEFMDMYFSLKYRDENTLIYFVDQKAVASLQMLPYTITFYGKEIPCAYMSGLCTLPEYRNRGYMAKLIHKAHAVLEKRGISLSILIPADEDLFSFYQKYGYEQVFEGGNQLIPIKQIVYTYQNLDDSYAAFDRLYRNKDFCIQKTKYDFEAILLDLEEGGFPDKINLSGMARIIQILPLLQLYAAVNKNLAYTLKVVAEDSVYSSVYRISKGLVEEGSFADPDIAVDIRLLCRLLFGYKLNELDSVYQQYFSQHEPVMNLMLE